MERNRIIKIEKEISKKEKFIKNFCKKKGWNPKELTTSQMLEIVRYKNY